MNIEIREKNFAIVTRRSEGLNEELTSALTEINEIEYGTKEKRPKLTFWESKLINLQEKFGHLHEEDSPETKWYTTLRYISSTLDLIILDWVATQTLSPDEVKDLCYKKSLIEVYKNKTTPYQNWSMFEHMLSGVIFALFSDHPWIRTKYCTLSKERDHPEKSSYLTTAIYALIDDNRKLYEECKIGIRRWKRIERRINIDFLIMDDIWSNNISGINSALKTLCTPNRTRNYIPEHNYHLSLPGAVYGKVARLRNMVVDPDLPLIPHYLLDSERKIDYEVYDFMKKSPFIDHVEII